MKTRRILAASTAALLAFGTTAVMSTVASADEVAAAEDIYVAKANKAASTNVKGAISFNGGDNYYVTAVKAYAKDLTGKEDGTEGVGKLVPDEDTLKGILEADETVTAMKANSGDVTVSIAVKDAMKLNGWYEIKVEEKEVNEDSDENVLFEEDEAIEDLGLSKENIAILKKTKANKVKLFNVTVAKNREIADSIGKNLKVEVDKSFAGAKVYHVNDDGSLTLVSSKTPNTLDSDKKTTFTTNKFSPFIVTTADLKATGASADDASSAAAATSDGATTTNPETGIALAIAPVVLAAGAVAVVALKKKH